ncbi:MAG: O-antigen ligase family protein [Clostridia bacterium]|nr:O-antigen ligase family protein [Clostridia bacterium]
MQKKITLILQQKSAVKGCDMVSFKNGVLRVQSESRESTARTIYDICFVLNTVTLFAFQSIKFIGTATGVLMLLAAMLLWIGRREKRVVIPYNTAWYALFTAYSALSSLWSFYIDADMAGYFLRMVVIVAMITSISIYVDKPEDLERLIKLYIMSMTIIVLLELTAVPVSEWSNGLVGSYFSGSNKNGVAFLVFCAELMAFYEFYSRGKKSYILLVAIFIVFIILSGSRKGIFAAVAGPLMFVVLSVYKKNYFFNIILVCTVAALIIFYIFTDENAYNAIGKRMESMFEFLFENRSQKVDNSIYMRTYYIQLAQELFSESPILGKGMGNFAKIIDELYDLNGVYSHNNYWQILSELGLVGFGIYYSMYFVIIIRLIKGAFVNKSRVNLLFLCFMILLMVLESGLVTYNSKMPHVVIAIAYASTYVGEMDGRKYQYIQNNIVNQ